MGCAADKDGGDTALEESKQEEISPESGGFSAWPEGSNMALYASQEVGRGKGMRIRRDFAWREPLLFMAVWGDEHSSDCNLCGPRPV